MRRRDELVSLRRIAEIRALQQGVAERELHRARADLKTAAQRQAESLERTAAQDLGWRAALSGPAVRLDLAAAWADRLVTEAQQQQALEVAVQRGRDQVAGRTAAWQAAQARTEVTVAHLRVARRQVARAAEGAGVAEGRPHHADRLRRPAAARSGAAAKPLAVTADPAKAPTAAPASPGMIAIQLGSGLRTAGAESIAAPGALASGAETRAFGFAELGLFGAYGAISAQAGVDLAAVAGQPAVSAASSAKVASSPTHIPEAALGDGPEPPGGGAPDRAIVAPDLAPSLRHGPFSPTPGAAIPEPPPVRSAQAPALEPSEAGALPAAPDPREADRSVAAYAAVAEDQGAVRIVLGAPGLPAEAQDRIQAAAQQLADEFGLRLDDLSLNGVPVLQRSPLSRNGAPHGYRPG